MNDTQAPTVNRFTDLKPTDTDSAIIQDETHGLIWSPTLNPSEMRVAELEKLVVELEQREQKGWRLPTVTELLTRVDYTKVDPATFEELKADTKSDWYLAGTPAAGSPGGAWFVGFLGGASVRSYRIVDGFVRAVRARQ